MRSRTPLLIACLAVATAAGWGCADFTRGPASPVEDAGLLPGDGGPASVDGGVSLGFASDVHSLLVSSCQSCHSAGGTAGDTAWVLTGDVDDDYAATVTMIDEASPTQSRLLTKGAGTGHVAGAVFPTSSAEYELILTWIQQGALP